MYNPNYQNVSMPNNFREDYYRKPYMNDTMQSNMSQMPILPEYAEGGMVEEPKKRKKEKMNPYPSLAEMIRMQGKGEDTILAHINPLEAMILQQMGGKGTTNPSTGLPQFGFLRNPFKAFKGSAGGIGGAIIGNMILPGVGGIIGGALGGAAGSALRGRKDYGQAALRGGLTGAILPTGASLLGSGASSLGMDSAGGYLSKYGSENAIMPSLGKLMGNNSVGNYVGSIGQNTGNSEDALTDVASKKSKDSGSWFSSLAKPKNLLTAATLAGSFMNRPKEKSPERLAQEQKRFNKASILTAEERAAHEADQLSEEQMRRRIARNKYLPEERFEVKPLYRKVNSPEEYARSGRWLNYYDNPLLMKKGGMIPQISFEEEELDYPSGQGFYMKGHTGGQNDQVNAKLSHGEFVVPSDVVSDLGDGNNNAGANIFYNLIKNVRSHKGRKNQLPPKAKSLASYMT